MTDLRVPHRAIGLRSCPGTVKGGTVSASSDTPPDLNVDTLAAAGVVLPRGSGRSSSRSMASMPI